MKFFTLITLVLVLGCATKKDLTESDIRIDDLYQEVEYLEFKRQEITANISLLKLQDRKDGIRLNQLNSELEDVNKNFEEYNSRIRTLEKNGEITSSQLQMVLNYVERLEAKRKEESDILKWLNCEIKKIENNECKDK